jgi:hypothetical protein
LKSSNILILSRHIIWILIIQLCLAISQFFQIYPHTPSDIVCECPGIIFFFPFLYIAIISRRPNRPVMIEVLRLCGITPPHFPPTQAVAVLSEHDVEWCIEALNCHLEENLSSGTLGHGICQAAHGLSRMVDRSAVIWIAKDEFVGAELADVVLRGRGSFVVEDDYSAPRDFVVLSRETCAAVAEPENIPVISVRGRCGGQSWWEGGQVYLGWI